MNADWYPEGRGLCLGQGYYFMSLDVYQCWEKRKREEKKLTEWLEGLCIFCVGWLPTFTSLLSSEPLSVFCNMTWNLQEQTRCGNLPATTTQQPDGEVVFESLTIDLPLAYILLCSQEFNWAWPLLFLSSEANYKSDKIIENSLLFLPYRLVFVCPLVVFPPTSSFSCLL